MALKLAATFQTTPEFWLNAQKAVDLYNASVRIQTLPGPIVDTERAHYRNTLRAVAD